MGILVRDGFLRWLAQHEQAGGHFRQAEVQTSQPLGAVQLVGTIDRIDAAEFAKRFHAGKLRVVDVRKDGEYAAEHVDGAWHASLQFINQNLAAFSKEETNYVHCAGGYRSMIAASLLKSRGYHNLVEVRGGFNAIKNTDVKVTDYVCPSTLKK